MKTILNRLSILSKRISHTHFPLHLSKSVYATQWKCLNIKSQFDRDGFLLLDSLNNEEINNIIHWTMEIEQDALNQRNSNHKSYERRGLHHFETDKLTNEERICRSERLIDFHNGLKEFLCNGKLKYFVSECFGEEAVLYKEKINYKYPYCGSFKAHQDAPAYPSIKKSISVAISIDETSELSGCLEIAKGRHKEGIIGQNEEGIICDNIVENVEKRERLVYEQIPTKPGDIILFDGYAPHKSGINKSDKPRRVMYLTFNPASEGDLRDDYYQKKKNDMLDGKISFIFDFDGNIVSTIGK